MPFDGSGNFTRLYSWTSDRDNGIKILATRMDGEFDNFAAGMNVVFFRNGLVPMSGNLNIGQNYINNVGAGSVGALAIKFGDDPNSGIYLDGMGKPAIVANGTKRLEVNTTGVAVTGALNVSGASAFVGAITRAGNTVWDAGNDGAGSGLDADLLDGQQGAYYADIPTRLGYIPVNRNGDTMTGKLQINASGEILELNTSAARGSGANYLTFSDPTGDKGFFGYAQFVSDEFLVYNALNSPMTLHTNATERMRIDASGNVGIRTNTPATYGLLAINGTVSSGTDNHISTVAGSGGVHNSVLRLGTYGPNGALGASIISQVNYTAGTGSTLIFGTVPNGAGITDSPSERMRLTSAGGLLIGTASDPAYGGIMRVQGGLELHNAQQLNIAPPTSNPFEFVNRAAGGFDFYTNSGSVLAARITAAGKVGIGTSGPNEKLQVAGTIGSIASSGSNGLVVGDFGAGAGTFTIAATTGRNLVFTDLFAGAERMRIDSTGNVGIGTAPATSSGKSLHVGGSEGQVRLTGSRTFVIAAGGNFEYRNNALVIYDVGAATERAYMDSTGQWFNAAAMFAQGFELGYRDIPRVTSGPERGKVMAASSAVTFNTGQAAGSTFSVYNDSAGAINLIQGAGLTLRLAGTTTTGTRTIAARAFATIWYNSTTEAIVSGAGVV